MLFSNATIYHFMQFLRKFWIQKIGYKTIHIFMFFIDEICVRENVINRDIEKIAKWT